MLRVSALTGFGGGGGAPIAILLSDLGNINSTPGTSATFSSVAVGSGSGRTLIVLASVKDAGTTTPRLNSCTVDGNACTETVSKQVVDVDDVCDVAIYIKKLTTESGSVDIVLGVSAEVTSFGMSFIIVTGLQSITETDSATGSETNPSTSVATDTTLDGDSAGIAVGVAAHFSEGGAHTWASSLTERSDVSTGGSGGDHRHSTGYDLLPTGRVAATETVTSASNNLFVLATATFR